MLAAVMIPVFLLLTALVVDVGNWYTHKRQLQNRADAAAFAAGVEYAKNWKACVQSGNAAAEVRHGQQDRRRRPAVRGRPRGGRLRGSGRLPPPAPVTRRSRTRRTSTWSINSTTYDNNTDYSDDYDGNPATNLGNPCYLHTTGDDISAPGYWTDVKVKERDLPSLFG